MFTVPPVKAPIPFIIHTCSCGLIRRKAPLHHWIAPAYPSSIGLIIKTLNTGYLDMRIFIEDFFNSQRKVLHFGLFNLFKESDGGQHRNESE
jgi:hypothetical protein